MYSGYGTTSPPLTNNPFISSEHPSSRFPDISSPPPQQQQQQYGTWSATGGGYPEQQQLVQQQQVGYGQPQQQMGMTMGGSGAGYLSPAPQSYPSQGGTAPFQPSSSFGQQLAGHMSGSSYYYLQGQQQQPQNATAYHPVQQQLQNNPGYIAQFDPYSSLGQALGGGGGNQAQNQGYNGYNQQQPGLVHTASMGSTMSSVSGGAASSYGMSATGNPHPKDYIRTHKTEIEAWDQYAWKQLIGTFEVLMQSWEGRKNELSRRVGELSQQMQAGMAYGQYYVAQIQQEGSRIQQLLKEAEENFDSVAASTFQMKEVFEGYRQSSDMAGKRRVKEATNAALQGLPGWPQPY
ncbi:hypothetical protein HYPSUDRAFT_36548 [Hypholoma sublateritium FD-334 SS-4]|uniref:Uncharacterized protein n=1 Tax=Hypholoma sublateritium (strain FD-334 SS-4) TaxID=945553 RepID=A0A0D2MQK8_HYPSF|nr:hypothetical protein HYPSUDRAFT_36548 [Hypholoma sublateritium FD-334 SS-4]